MKTKDNFWKGFFETFAMATLTISIVILIFNQEPICYEEINTKETLCEDRFNRGILVSEEKYYEENQASNYYPYIAFGVLSVSLLMFLMEKKDKKKNKAYGSLIGGIVGLLTMSAFLNFFINIWIFIVLLILLGELIFFIDKKKPNRKEKIFWFTLKRKSNSLLFSLGILMGMIGLTNLSTRVTVPLLPSHLYQPGIVVLSVPAPEYMAINPIGSLLST